MAGRLARRYGSGDKPTAQEHRSVVARDLFCGWSRHRDTR